MQLKLEQLSQEQLNAVNCPDSRILINASPGAAKTTVLGLVAIKHAYHYPIHLIRMRLLPCW